MRRANIEVLVSYLSSLSLRLYPPVCKWVFYLFVLGMLKLGKVSLKHFRHMSEKLRFRVTCSAIVERSFPAPCAA